MSLYLGTVGNDQNQYEIHAFTNEYPFKAFTVSEISDPGLYSAMIGERFRSLVNGRTIYCTAVSPDSDRKIEENPHDNRTGTVHVASVHKATGNLSCILSVAVDTGEKDGADVIGLPLENRWRRNGYSEGYNLDQFREKYVKLNRGEDEPVRPWQMAELYRHLRVEGDPGEQIARLGIYVGLYHLLVREPRNRGQEETSIWLFDAIPKYFHLYRLAGAAVLRDPTIEDSPRHISPNINNIEKDGNGASLLYNGHVVSRIVETLKPIPGILGDVSFMREMVPFIDGVIDIHKMESAVVHDPEGLGKVRYQGMTETDITILSIAQAIFCKRLIDEMLNHDTRTLESARKKRELIAPVWHFSEVGR